jgi:Bacterial sugar transferase.
VDHRSLLLDVRILLRTARVVLGRRRAGTVRLRHGAAGVARPIRAGQRVEEDGALAASGPSAVKGVTR